MRPSRQTPPFPVAVRAPWEWGRLVVATAARATLFFVLGLLFWGVAPALWGWQSTTVVSDSMSPQIRTGDVIVTMPGPEPLGRVTLFDDPDRAGELKLHRVIAVTDDDRFVTKGDANGAADSETIDQDAVHGIGVIRSPWIGLPFVWAREQQWHLLILTGLTCAVIAAMTGLDAPLRPGVGGGRRNPAPIALAAVIALSVATAFVASDSSAVFTRSTAGSASLAAANPYPCFTVTPADSPFFYYAFNASGSSVLDSSANARTATFGTGVTRQDTTSSCTAGPNPSILLDGTVNGQVIPPTAGVPVPGPMTYTLEAWFRTTSTASGRILGLGNARTGVSTEDDRNLYLDTTGHIVFGAFRDASPAAAYVAQSPGVYNNGAWHHAVATMSPTNGMRLYIDGALVATNANVLSHSYTAPSFWRIGYDKLNGWPGTSAFGFTGSLDDVAVYTTELTAAQVTAHFTAGRR